MEKQAEELALRLYELANQFLAPFKDGTNDTANPFGDGTKNVNAGEPGEAVNAGTNEEAVVTAEQDGRPTFTQLRLLLAVQKGKNQVGILARLGNVSQPAVSKMVDGVVRLGLLRREPHAEDRRQILLVLTEKGLEAIDKARFKSASRYVQAIRGLSQSDRKKISDGIQVILEVIDISRKEQS